MKSFIKKILFGFIATLAVWLGASGQVLFAAGEAAVDGNGSGATEGAEKPANTATDPGVQSVTNGQQAAPDLYETDLEQAILVLDPMGTAGLTIIETGAQSRKVEDQEFEFYSVGPRVIRTTTTAMNTSTDILADRILLPVADKGFAAKDDTIRVVGFPGNDGKDLMLIVIDRDTSTGKLACYCKNGTAKSGGVYTATSTFIIDSSNPIPAGTTVVRMAKSCSESKAQTSRANAFPSSEKGYVQNFMLQIEQTEFDRMTKKRVSWDFDDIVDWNMRDYKVVKELTYLFSVGGLDRHLSNDNEDNYTMTGIWWQTGRNLEIGHIATDGSGNTLWEEGPNGETAVLGSTLKYTVTTTDDTSYTLADGTTSVTATSYYYAIDDTNHIAEPAVAKVEINGSDLVRFNKQAFIGNGGSQIKYLIAGANVVEAFDNIKGKQYENKDIVTEDNLIVQNFKTSFGTIKLVYDKLFDVCGMANAALMLDKQYLRKVEFKSMSKTDLDLKKSGQRNSHGVVLQEVNAVYLQYADAHAQVWLAGRTEVYDYVVAGKYDTVAMKTSKNVPGRTENVPGGHKPNDQNKYQA